MTGRVLFALIAGIAVVVTLIVIVVIPGVQRGGWLEVAAVFAAVAAFALADRWLRRLMRRR